MDDASLELLFRDWKLHVIGGFLGGGMALCVIDATGLAAAGKRLFCSLAAAVVFTHLSCRLLRHFYTAFPEDRLTSFAVSGIIGISAWFALHWPLNYLDRRKDKELWDIAEETARKAANLKKERMQ